MSQTITVDGDEVIDATIDGEAVEEITIDGVLAWAAEVGLDGLTVTRQDGSYTANNNDHVVSNGGTITLPSPVQDGIVMITKVETRPELTGTVDGISEPYISGDESAVFVSDGNEWYSVDRNQLGAIPDSGDLQARYDFSQEDGTTPVVDQTGNGYNLTGDYQGVSRSINGVQAGEFTDSTTTNLSVSFSGDLSEPYHVFAVVNYDTTGFKVWFDGKTKFEAGLYEFTDGWRLFQGNTVINGGTRDTNTHVWNARFANDTNQDDRLRLDKGNEVQVTGQAGQTDLSGIVLGSRGDNSDYFDGLIGEVLVYQTDKTAIETEIEDYLIGKWGVTI
jgi:hypothetical protein